MDISGVEAKLQKCMQSKADRERIIKKKHDKVKQLEDGINQQQIHVETRISSMEKALYQSRQLVYTTTKQKEKKQLRDEAVANGEEFDEDQDSDEPTDAELESIAPIIPNKSQATYKTKIQRIQEAILVEKNRRLISDTTQEATLKKFQRAKKSLDDKVMNVENIEDNAKKLTDDLKDRVKRWGQFRGEF